MKKLVLLAVIILVSGCASAPMTNTQANSIAQEIRKPSSTDALTIEGQWSGRASFYHFNDQKYPLVCQNLIAQAQATGQPCERYSSAGKFVNVQIKCADDLLSKKGQDAFSQNVNICQSTKEAKRASNGETFWITSLGPETRIKEEAGYRIIADISEYDAKEMQDMKVPKADKIIAFKYVNTQAGPKQSYTLDAIFYKAANP